MLDKEYLWQKQETRNQWKSGGQKMKNWSKTGPKEKFQGKEEPSWENNCRCFQYENSDCDWLCHRTPKVYGRTALKCCLSLCCGERDCIQQLHCKRNFCICFIDYVVSVLSTEEKNTSFACTFSNYDFSISFPQQLSLSNIGLHISRSVLNNIAFQVFSMVWCHL